MTCAAALTIAVAAMLSAAMTSCDRRPRRVDALSEEGGTLQVDYATPGLAAWGAWTVAWHPSLPALATSDGMVALEPEVPLGEWGMRRRRPSGKTMFGGCGWTADGRYLVASRVYRQEPRSWELVRIDMDTGATDVLAGRRFGVHNGGPKCAPVGDLVAFLSFASGYPDPEGPRLCIVGSKGGEPVAVMPSIAWRFFEWSRSGKALMALQRHPQDSMHLVVYVLGRGKVYSSPLDMWMGAEGWLDDERLLFVGRKHAEGEPGGPPYGLLALGWRSGSTEYMLPLSGDRRYKVNSAKASPDGRAIACMRQNDMDEPDAFDLLVYDVERGTSRCLASTAGNLKFEMYGPPAWSPDSTRLAYWRDSVQVHRPPELWVIGVDGTGDRRVWPPQDDPRVPARGSAD